MDAADDRLIRQVGICIRGDRFMPAPLAEDPYAALRLLGRTGGGRAAELYIHGLGAGAVVETWPSEADAQGGFDSLLDRLKRGRYTISPRAAGGFEFQWAA